MMPVEGEMMEYKGEWKVFERLDGTIWICLNKPPVYPLIAKINANFPEEVVANAHLIAAAPDMYEALKIMREQIANMINPKVKILSMKDQLALMDKAIIKAEGE